MTGRTLRAGFGLALLLTTGCHLHERVMCRRGCLGDCCAPACGVAAHGGCDCHYGPAAAPPPPEPVPAVVAAPTPAPPLATLPMPSAAPPLLTPAR